MDQTVAQLIELLDTCGQRLHALLAKLTKDRDCADDLLQELFLRMMKSNGLNKAPNREAYIFRAAINLAFDWRKRDRRSKSNVLFEDDFPAPQIAPIDKVIREETTEQVLVAMESLSEEDRELISLRFIQEESNQWIAQHFDSTPHVIRSRCSKALERLRKRIKQTPNLQSKEENHER